MCDVFLPMVESDITNYTDDTILHSCQKTLFDAQKNIESDSTVPLASQLLSQSREAVNMLW